MIDLKHVLLAVNTRIEEIYPEIPIQSSDIEEGFSRPSFFVEFGDVRTAAYGPRGKERNIPVTVYYFPSDRYKNRIELLEVQERLEQTFSEAFAVQTGFVVYPVEVTSTIVDGVMQTSFEVYYIETDNSETGEEISELYLNIEKRD
ncbi:phage tail terminator family protein [Paenibacillus chibensis]|uniref:phage tail terminator family protein n=1 Tax=Paenibacillus chibensis TaxID=59846 RepID=UPI000FD9878B|nr:hypothetical protein [Paenibacillus chibensis]MEC0370884.1 hypothetical protein [Paenibacillus chibensis]